MPRQPRDHPERDNSADGLSNRIEAHMLSHYPAFWNFVMTVPFLRKIANKAIINRAVMRARTRPSPYGSMAVQGDSAKEMAGYTSWEMMTDTAWFGRHLPATTPDALPALEDVRALFVVPKGQQTESENSSVLFLSFAQWFTDGFLMTDARDTRKTNTSHHIDFNPLYGLNRAESDAIREKSEARGQKGRLKFETDPISGEVFAPKLYDASGAIKPEFAALRPPLKFERYLSRVPPARGEAVKQTLFAFAGDRANTTPYTAMLNTLFLREHNRLCGLLEADNPAWDDERVFQTARNVNIALLIKIVVEEYINHISPYYFQISADPSVCWHAQWNKPNWIPIEFNLLYRWHSLTPDHFEIADTAVPPDAFIFDQWLLTAVGLGPAMARACGQRAWNMGLMNTPDFLIEVEMASVVQGRLNQLASYNDYRAAMGFGRVRAFNQITGDPARQDILKRLYGDVDKVEFFVGLFAEDVAPRAAVPPLIGRMVALDAFSQALTNPLLSEHIFNAQTFGQAGWQAIQSTSKLQDVLNRNLGSDTKSYVATMTI
ncbi:peroxidase family protein [Cypionkella sp.]|uniref:peroxidase family protein n=1 Tax=Cypionkella sp. TaxID=2811411 RepID=UPI002637106A|nr:peroxidase family protein [Cypionkella sp.]